MKSRQRNRRTAPGEHGPITGVARCSGTSGGWGCVAKDVGTTRAVLALAGLSPACLLRSTETPRLESVQKQNLISLDFLLLGFEVGEPEKARG